MPRQAGAFAKFVGSGVCVQTQGCTVVKTNEISPIDFYDISFSIKIVPLTPAVLKQPSSFIVQPPAYVLGGGRRRIYHASNGSVELLSPTNKGLKQLALHWSSLCKNLTSVPFLVSSDIYVSGRGTEVAPLLRMDLVTPHLALLIMYFNMSTPRRLLGTSKTK